jgi:hypothetical protein
VPEKGPLGLSTVPVPELEPGSHLVERPGQLPDLPPTVGNSRASAQIALGKSPGGGHHSPGPANDEQFTAQPRQNQRERGHETDAVVPDEAETCDM